MVALAGSVNGLGGLLKKITVPVLVMHGDDDQIVLYKDSGPLSAQLVHKGTLQTYDHSASARLAGAATWAGPNRRTTGGLETVGRASGSRVRIRPPPLWFCVIALIESHARGDEHQRRPALSGDAATAHA
jgi:hypothetical protein